MVVFDEYAGSMSHHFFLKEDPARIYRGLKDMLVEEFDMDRIEEGKMEFNTAKPKDRIRLHAFKEKSPHTVIEYYINLKAKPPRDVYKVDRDDDILKARVKLSSTVYTMYPGGEPLSWLPKIQSYEHIERVGEPHLGAEEKTAFQKSKFYRILVGIWYNKFYSKEIHMYEEEAEEVMLRIQNLMRDKLGVEEAIGRTGSSHYDPPWKGQ